MNIPIWSQHAIPSVAQCVLLRVGMHCVGAEKMNLTHLANLFETCSLLLPLPLIPVTLDSHSVTSWYNKWSWTLTTLHFGPILPTPHQTKKKVVTHSSYVDHSLLIPWGHYGGGRARRHSRGPYKVTLLKTAETGLFKGMTFRPDGWALLDNRPWASTYCSTFSQGEGWWGSVWTSSWKAIFECDKLDV
jgi:hypothetical protein